MTTNKSEPIPAAADSNGICFNTSAEIVGLDKGQGLPPAWMSWLADSRCSTSRKSESGDGEIRL